MLSRLAVLNGMRVLEPSAGDGAFVEALLGAGLDLCMCCIDKNPEAVRKLRDRFGGRIQAAVADTILDQLGGEEGILRKLNLPTRFDRIIGNPPYGGWLDYHVRADLKRAFPDFHVRETYGLFFVRCLELLDVEGVLSFIVPDTFLIVGAHRPLRELLLKRTEIVEIVTLPSKMFPRVAFGYSGLCIITLRKPRGLPDSGHSFRIVAVSTTHELDALARGRNEGTSTTVLQRVLLQRPEARIWTSREPDLEALIHAGRLRLGDVAECRTGIYTGDNKRFIRAIEGHGCRGEYYGEVARGSACTRILVPSEMSAGISDGPSWIPLVKGGSSRFFQADNWAIDWSKQAVAHYKEDSKARFQNSDFYFREGIGVPMVTSTRINAFLLGRRVFDQSVVAIFPRRREWLFPLLVILNSAYATRLLKEAINPTANNSANYLKQLPLPNATAVELRKLGALGRLIFRRLSHAKTSEVEVREAEEFACSLYGREQLPTTPDTWSNFAGSSGDTPLLPCLREKPRSYGSNRRGRKASRTG
jgi:hypothetical protein